MLTVTYDQHEVTLPAIALIEQNEVLFENHFAECRDIATMTDDEKGKLFYNFFQFKAHPLGGNKLFDKAYSHLEMHSHNFVSHWQKAEAEIIDNGYSYNCPDCGGSLHKMSNKIH